MVRWSAGFAVLIALVVLVAAVDSASAGFKRTHRASSVDNPSQVNFWTNLEIADVGYGQVSHAPTPKDGLGDLVGTTNRAGAAPQQKGLWRILQSDPQSPVPWGFQDGYQAHSLYNPSDMATARISDGGQTNALYFLVTNLTAQVMNAYWEFSSLHGGSYNSDSQYANPKTLAVGEIYSLTGAEVATIVGDGAMFITGSSGNGNWFKHQRVPLTNPALPHVCNGRVLVADLDGANALDVLHWGPTCTGTTPTGGNGMDAYIASPTGTPTPPHTLQTHYSLGSGLRDVQAADVTGDGKQDLVFTYDSGYAVAEHDDSLHLNSQANLHFGFQPGNSDTPVTRALDGGGGALRIADVAAPDNPAADTDTFNDLVIAQPAAGRIRILANDPDNAGTFAAYGEPIPFGDGVSELASSGGPDGLAVGKLNRDNRIDIAAFATRANIGVWETYNATRPPAVSLGASKAKAFVGDSITFTADLATRPDSSEDNDVASVKWDFDGDGSVDETTSTLGTTHSYTTIGDKPAKVTVVNSAGDSGVASLSPPIRIGTQLGATISPATPEVAPGTTQTFTVFPTGGYPVSGGAVPSYTIGWSSDADVKTPNGSTFDARWNAAKRGSVTASVSDGQGQTLDVTVSVRVANAMTVTLAPQNGHNPAVDESVVLAATAGGGIAPLSYKWDLDGNGSYETDTGSTATVTTTFTAVGTPTVGVQVTDSDSAGGRTATHRPTMTVRAKLVAALTRSPQSPAPGDQITLDTRDTTGGEPPYDYAWEIDNTVDAGETGATLTRIFATPGRHKISVTVRDSVGRTSTAEQEFRVASPLEPDFTATPASPQLDEIVQFDAASSHGGIPPYEYKWDLDGDGSFDAAADNDPTPKYVYPDSGIVQVTLQLTDFDGLVETITRPVGVAVELTAGFRVTPAQPAPGALIAFDAADTVGGTPGSGGRYDEYEWTIDGVAQTDPGDDTPRLERTFNSPGRHTVDLTVTDAIGRTSAAPQRTFVVAAPLVPEFTAQPSRPETGEQVSFDAAPTSGGLPPVRYSWDLDGDGAYETDTGTTASVSTTYQTPGVRQIGLRVSDDDNVVRDVTHALDVAPGLQARLSFAPAIPQPGQPVLFDAGGSSGGAGAHGFGWDFDAGETFPLAAAATVTRSFDTIGDHKVAVRVRDTAGHQSIARDLLTVADPLTAQLGLSPENPETGDKLALDASASAGGVRSRRFAFDLDGDGEYEADRGGDATADRAADRPGLLRLGVRVSDERDQTAVARREVDVTPRLEPAFDIIGHVEVDREAEFDAAGTTGGVAPLRYRWDFDGNGSYESDGGAATTRTNTFKRASNVEVGLSVSDARGHIRAVRKQVTVAEGCIHELAFGLTRIRTATAAGCLRTKPQSSRTAPLVYGSDDDLIVNGMLIDKLAGATLEVTLPTADKAARIASSAAQVVVDGARVVNGAFDWKLPEGKRGEERQIAGLGLAPDGVDLLGLHAEGRIGLSLGMDTSGKSYVRFSVNLEIPGFKIGPDSQSPGVTTKVSMRIDDTGVHLDNLKLRLDHAYVGKLEINDLCLSYVRAGYQADRCEQFEDHTGEPFLTCSSDESVDRWDGTMDLTLPTPDKKGIAFSGDWRAARSATSPRRPTSAARWRSPTASTCAASPPACASSRRR